MDQNIAEYNFMINDGNELEIIEDVSRISQYDYKNSDQIGGILNVSVKINNDGNLEVNDITPYEKWQIDNDFSKETIDEDEIDPEKPWKKLVHHQVVERVVLNDGEEEPKLIVWYCESANSYKELRHCTEYDVPGNGLYHYQKLILPTKEHAQSNENEHVYYDPDTKKVYFEDLDGGETAEYNISSDFDDIYSLVAGRELNNCFYYSSDTFSMYDLVKCYVSKEYDRLMNWIKNNCSGDCSKDSALNQEADLLLAAIMVIERLIEEDDYFEAQRILNALNTCGSICKNYSNKLKGCGCGRN